MTAISCIKFTEFTVDNTQKRYHVLDGLRGVAAIIITLYHFFMCTNLAVFPQGFVAVDLFFCLSGFVISHAYQERILSKKLTFKGLVKVRLIRLYPMYLVGILTGALLLLVLMLTDLSRVTLTTLGLLTGFNLVFLPYFPSSPVNYGAISNLESFPLNTPFWSLPFEMLLSMLLFMFVKLSRNDQRVFIGFAVFAFLAAGGPSGGTQPTFLLGFGRSLLPFLIGMTLYKHRDKISQKLPNMSFSAMALLTVIGFGPFLKLEPFHSLLFYYAFTLFISPLLLCLGANCHVEHSEKLRRCNEYLGKLSYPLYCIHFVIVHLLIALYGVFSTNAEEILDYRIALVGLIASYVLAHICMKYIEPCVKRKIQVILQ